MGSHTLLGAFLLLVIGHVLAAYVDPKRLDACPGYRLTELNKRPDGMTAILVLKDKACGVFGDDIKKLSLSVLHESSTRIHVKITDASSPRYEIPASVLPLPKLLSSTTDNVISFNYTTDPFSFSIFRSSTKEVLFSVNSSIIFEDQYIRIKSSIPVNANIYGLGEHSNPFRIPTDNTTLTLWSRDAFGLPTGTNLYGAHPVYFEHRTTGTHGVFFRNSNGMDIKITKDGGADGGPALEYNVIGGVIDLSFLAGSETDPTEVARQYAEVVGTPAEVPYWSFGLHQCRFGYKNFIDVANVITNYSASNIPLETMWTDIDYMDRRRIFTVDPDYFPLNKMREIVSYLHAHGQKYILMTDPAIAYDGGDGGYVTYQHGHELDIFLKATNGSESLGVVWPGVTVFPDWFHPKVQQFWTEEFKSFYSQENGIDIDGAWIDMNEPSNFCTFPCDNPFQEAIDLHMPPARDTPKPDPNATIFSNGTTRMSKRDLINPPYAIDNAFYSLSNKTASTNIIHFNGQREYDTHNLYGTMMSKATRVAMLDRRPGKRTFVITRSTFAGAGSYVQKWLGDNLSTWEHYRSSIAQMLGFASVYQVPMVGSDICGFGGNTSEEMCARWATLGAFYTFMRNHNIDTGSSQEFYVWPVVAEAARNALDMRYRLLDYIYTAFHQASIDGTPVLHPLWNKYPKDPNTFNIDLQFFYGDSILVSPVTAESSTSVNAYFPNDIFYDFKTLEARQGQASYVTLENINLTQIPVHIKGGTVLPLRVKSAMTTDELRKEDFEFIVAPNAAGEAFGQLYVDDGESITPKSSTLIKFSFKDKTLTLTGRFDYPVKLARIRILGVKEVPKGVNAGDMSYDKSTMILDIVHGQPLNKPFELKYYC